MSEGRGRTTCISHYLAPDTRAKCSTVLDHMPGAPAGFKNVDAQPVGSGASLREMIRNIDNYFAIG